MKLRHIFTAILAFFAAFAINAQKIGHYVVKLNDFSQLKVIDGININYVSSVDSAGMAVFDAPDNIAPLIVFTPGKDKLTIQYDVRNQKYKDMPTVTVYSKFLTSVENHTDSTIRILKLNSGPEFKAKVMGNGKIIAKDLILNKLSANITTGRGMIIVSGQCETANYTNLGTGQIQADSMKANDVKCKIGGTGAIGCNALNNLDVVGVGTGKIYYRGTPKTINKNTIKIEIIPLDE